MKIETDKKKLEYNLKTNILVIDDLPIENNPVRDFLLTENYNVLHVNNGVEAFEILKNEKIDLIILDIMMPNMDGYQVCKELKQNIETSMIPIIFLTAKGDIDSILKGFEYGAEDYIIKPFNGVELLARVNTHLELRYQREILSSINEMLGEKVKEKTKELEIANKKLGTLEKAKNNFLSLISHEVRTPLNAIMGFTALFELTDLTNEQKEYLQYLKESTQKLLKLAESALLISSLTIDEYDVRFNYVFFKDILNTAVKNIKSKIEKKKILVLSNISEDLFLKVDFSLIVKVFELILENFIAYSKPEQKIILECDNSSEEYTLIQIIIKKNFIQENEIAEKLKIFLLEEKEEKNEWEIGLNTAKYIMNAHSSKIEAQNNSENFILNLYFNKKI